MNLIKLLNLAFAGVSFAGSMISGNANMKGMPVSISVELTNNCNLRCPECPAGGN